jgi:hypothetical protein
MAAGDQASGKRMIMHARRLGGLVVCASLVVVGGTQVVVGGTQANASSDVSGNPAAIAYVDLVAAATQRMGAEEETIPGQEAIEDYVTPQSWHVSTEYIVGASMPSGYVPTVEYTTIAAKAARLVWASTIIVPSRCPTASAPTCTRTTDNITALFLLTSAGSFIHPYHYPDLCWSKGTGTVANRTQTGGAVGYYPYGDYLPLRRAGATMVVTETYSVGGGQTGTETDTIAVATHLPISTVVNVPAASGHPGYTQHFGLRWLTTAPPEPQVGTLCS